MVLLPIIARTRSGCMGAKLVKEKKLEQICIKLLELIITLYIYTRDVIYD